MLGLTDNTTDIINDIAGLKQDKTLAKTLSVDSSTIDLALAKLILGLNKNSKKTRKEQNLIKKIEEIRNTIQDAVLYAKLKKSIRTKSEE